MKKMPSWLMENYIAHRGYFSGLVPENSMMAFELAINREFAIELDLHLLKCGTVVVFHDTNLKRMTGINKLISDVTYDEIKNLKLNESKEHIPTLAEVLEFVNGKTPLMIEFKNESAETRLEKASYELLKSYEGEYVVQSFNPISVKWFKQNANHVIRGQLSSRYESTRHKNMGILKKFILRNLLFNVITQPDYVNYEIKALDTFIIKYLKFTNKPLLAYTAKSYEEYKFCLEKGINACFEGFDPVAEKEIDINKGE